MSIRIGDRIISGGGGGGNGESLTNQNLSSDITQVYNWVGTYADYVEQDVANTHPDWVCYITDDEFGDEQEYEIVQYTGHNVGDIFFTSRKDGWLNGAVECNGEVYTTTDYVGEESIGELLKKNLVPYVSMSEYETLLTNNGSVGVFGWNGGDNNQFRVPTLNDLFLETGKATELGEFVKAGLPNISGNVTFYGVEAWNGGGDGAFKVNVSTNTSPSHHVSGNEKIPILNFDASRSNVIYGSSDTVQPNAVRYRAMVQLSTGFNDEAIDTCRTAKEDISKIKSSISNCITKIPQDIKIESSGNIITLKAGSKVYVPNGFEVDGITRIFEEVITPSDCSVEIGTGWDTNKTLVFYDKNHNNIYCVHNIACYTGDAQPTFIGSGLEEWYDTNINKMKRYNNGVIQSDFDSSLPIVLLKNEYGIGLKSIDQVFNGFGYIGKLAFTLPGVCGLSPNGRNEDGSLISKKIEITEVKIREELAFEVSKLCFLGKDGIYGWGVSAYYESDKKPDSSSFDQHCFWYNTIENISYATDDYGATWTKKDLIFLGNLQKLRASDNITELSPKKVFKAVDANEADYVIHYQKPTADNNYTWYRLYKSGWVEQGGSVRNVYANSTQTITFPIVMTGDYYAEVSDDSWTANGYISRIYERTSTGMKLGIDCFEPAANPIEHKLWRVCGMAA